jgi:hypothetical protein
VTRDRTGRPPAAGRPISSQRARVAR